MRRIALFALFALALALRSAGLSHDLAEGYVYHPDSPKQMSAVQRFLRGQYYFHTGNRDVDGYPYLNAHLVEIAYRAFHAVASGAGDWLGVRDDPPEVPDRLVLHWMTRGLNVLLSSATVVAIAVIGLEAFGPRVAVVAGLFAALSPLDVAACHEANSDTTAAFFAVLALLCACRVLAHGRMRDTALATVFATASFAAKYHGAVAIFALVVAHVLRFRGWRSLVGAESLGRIGVAVVAGIAALAVTIPPLVTHPAEITRDILDFLAWVAREARVPEEARGGTFNRVTFSMARNVPILAQALSLPLLVVVAAGLVRLRRSAAPLAVLYAMPLVYFFVGIAFRPLAPAVNHVIVSAPLLLVAAALLDPWARSPRRAVRAGTFAVVVASAIWLGATAARELFFAYRQDTRLLARLWTRENVPPTFGAKSPGYGFQWRPIADGEPKGGIWVVSDLRPAPVPPGLVHLKRFFLERDSLQGFRNPVLDVFIDTPLLAPGFVAPILPRIPSRTGNEVVFVDPDPFYRSTKLVPLEPGESVRRTIVAPERLRDVLLVVHGGAFATRVKVSFGGTEAEIDVGPEEVHFVAVPAPRRRFPFDREAAFYDLTAEALTGRASVEIATDPAEQGVALFRAGRFAQALAPLREAARAKRDPAIAALALAAAAVSDGALDAEERKGLRDRLPRSRSAGNRDRLDESYGGTLRYLDALDYVAGEAEELAGENLLAIDDPRASHGGAVRARESAEGRAAKSILGLPKLEAGLYRARWRMRGERADVVVVALVDRLGRARDLESREIAPSAGFVEHEAELELAEAMADGTLTLRLTGESESVLDTLALEPDVRATLDGFVRLAKRIERAKPARAPLPPWSYPLLVAQGRKAADRGDAAAAAAAFREAAALRPGLAPALEGLAALDARWREPGDAERLRELEAARDARRFRRAPARFPGGFELLGYRLEQPRVVAGGEFGLDLEFAAPRDASDLDPIFVRVQLRDDEGRVALRAHRRLREYLLLDRDPADVRPWFFRLVVPADVRPGEYRLEVGLWNRETKRRLRPEGSLFGGRKKALELPDRLTVERP